MPRTSPPSTFETSLATLSRHHLAVECSCGHNALVPIAPALERLGPYARVRDMIDRLRCTACGRRGGVEARIVF